MTSAGRPDRWRPALGPLGALWTVSAVVAIVPGHDPRRLGLEDAAGDWPRALLVVAAGLAWVAIGLLTPLLAAPVAALWLGRWPIGWRALTARRRERWNRADRLVSRLAAQGASVEAQANAMARRAAIALAPPHRPTWMGDRWSAVEQRIAGAHGLDLVTVWPRLWLAMPEPARTELRAAKAGWDRSTQLAAWAMPFAALGLAWWPLLGVSAVLGAAGWLQGRAALAYRADLIEAAFDLYAGRLPNLLTGLDPHAGSRLTARLRQGT